MRISIMIVLLASIPAYYLAMRYNMHMLQLNGYKNNEHIKWIRKNLSKQWILIYLLFLGIINVFVNNVLLDSIAIVSMLLVVLNYNALRKINVKKKMVFTARLKRLLVTNIVLSVGCVLVVALLGETDKLGSAAVCVVAIQLVGCILANIINFPIEHGVRRYYINDAKKKLRKVEHLKVLGVTGSYGKTSIKFYLQTLLKEKYNVLITPESYNTPMGVVKTIRESLKSTHEIFICEMGARHVGDIKEICDIVNPQHGVISSIGPQHLETFFSIDNIKKTKFELADALPSEGILFLNGDNEYIRQQAEGYQSSIVYYSQADKGNYYAKDISISQLGTEFTVCTPTGESERFHMKLIGSHNVINVMGAIAVAHTLGISLKDLIIPVRRIQPVEHRLQMKEYGQVTIIDDAYNSNPAGSKAAVETLALFDGLRILVTPGMVELGAEENEYNRLFGTYAAKCCDYILLVGKNHTKPIKEGALSEGFDEKKCLSFDKFEEALAYAYSIKCEEHKYILLENDLPDNY